jgi:hypothetical protein
MIFIFLSPNCYKSLVDSGGGGQCKTGGVNRGVSRKEFLRIAVMGTAGLAVIPSFGADVAPAAVPAKLVYRLRPLPGKKYSRSFIKFSKQMTFASAAAAVRRVKDRSQGYQLVAEPV